MNKFKKNNIRFKVIGNKNSFSKKLKKTLIKAEKETNKCSRLQINLALNYGSKDEIIYAFHQLKKNKTTINSKNLEKKLYTKGQVDPDILIRTGGQKRLSNFMLWQLAYTELYFIDKLWPDFKESDYLNIIKKYKLIKRNYGGI